MLSSLLPFYNKVDKHQIYSHKYTHQIITQIYSLSFHEFKENDSLDQSTLIEFCNRA